MYRSLELLGALSLAAAVSTTARAQASSRVTRPQAEVGPPAPVELVGTPREASPKAKKMSPMMASLTSAASDIRTDARAGTLVSRRTHAAIPAGATQAVVSIMTMPTAEADRQVRNALTISGRSNGDVDGMVSAIAHLLSEPDAGQIRDAQKHFDRFMKETPSWYRDNPPAEVLAMDAALEKMSEAEASAQGKKYMRASRTPEPKRDEFAGKTSAKDDKAAKQADKKSSDRKSAAKTKASSDKKSSTNAKKPSLWRRLLPFV